MCLGMCWVEPELVDIRFTRDELRDLLRLEDRTRGRALGQRIHAILVGAAEREVVRFVDQEIGQ